MAKTSPSRASLAALGIGVVACVAAVGGVHSLAREVAGGDESLSFANSYTLNHHHNNCGALVVQQNLSSTDLGVTVFPSSQLGGDADRLASLIDGDIDLDIQGPSSLASVVPELGVMDMAYVFDDADHLFTWFDSADAEPFIEEFEEKGGFKILDVWYLGDRTFHASEPIRTPDDLQGLRIRYPESSAHLASAEAVGAEPVAVSFEEIYMSLQQGLVDGQENPISTSAESSLDEVTDYVSLTRHAVGNQLVIMSQSSWDRLDPQQQQSLEKAVKDVRDQNRKCAEDAEQEILSGFADAGSPEVVSDVDRDSFRTKAQTYWEETLTPEQRELYDSIRSTS